MYADASLFLAARERKSSEDAVVYGVLGVSGCSVFGGDGGSSGGDRNVW